jgi:hypothetical protein
MGFHRWVGSKGFFQLEKPLTLFNIPRPFTTRYSSFLVKRTIRLLPYLLFVQMTEQALFKQQDVKPTIKQGKQEKKERKAPVVITLTHHLASNVFATFKKALESPAAEDQVDVPATPTKKRAREETELKVGDAGVPSAAKKAKKDHASSSPFKSSTAAAGAGAGSGSGSSFHSKFCS